MSVAVQTTIRLVRAVHEGDESRAAQESVDSMDRPGGRTLVAHSAVDTRPSDCAPASSGTLVSSTWLVYSVNIGSVWVML